MSHDIEARITRRRRRSTPAGLATVCCLTLVVVGCGSKDTPSSSQAATTVVATTSPATAIATTATTSASAVPTCAEVDAMLAQLTPAEQAMFARADFLYVGRGPTGGDTWRIYTQVDVTQQVLEPQVAVYWDWSPETGLSKPVIVDSFAERDALVDPTTLQTVLKMRCTEQ